MRGLKIPKGTLWQIYRPRYPFDIEHLDSLVVDPRDWEPRWEISEKKRMAEVDPEQAFAELELLDVLRLWTSRYSIYNSRGKHPMFEVLCHLIFPKKEERSLAYIAIWLIRDKLSKAEIMRRLGSRGHRKMHPQTINKYVKYVEAQIYNFTRRTRMKEKFAEEIMAEMEADEDRFYDEDAREIVGG